MIGLRTIRWASVAAGLAMTSGCSRAPDVTPEPAVFPRADEIVRDGDLILLADRRVFAVMAFINACGFDDEVEGESMHPVRIKVRERLRTRPAGGDGRWRRYYADKRLAAFEYIDFALSLSPDAPLRRIRPNSELTYPHAARTLADFPDVLNEFWQAAGLESTWNEVKAEYGAELKRYDMPRMRREIADVWTYLRMKKREARVYVAIPNLLDAHYRSQIASYEHYLYVVQGPGAGSYGLNAHEYLHPIVNGLVQARHQDHKDKLQRYYETGRRGPLARTYQDPVVFTYECLVRALDARLDGMWPADGSREDLAREIEARVDRETREGLSLVRPFYALLPGFEASGQSFEAYLPALLERLPEHQP